MGRVFRVAAIVLVVGACGLVGVARGGTSVPADPALTAEQLQDLRQVTTWHIVEQTDLEESGSGSGTFDGGAYDWSGSDSYTYSTDATVDVAGPAGCAYSSSIVNDCVPTSGSGELDEHDTTTEQESQPICPAPNDSGASFAEHFDVSGTQPIANDGGNYFSVDYSTNPPTVYASMYSEDIAGTHSDTSDPDPATCSASSSSNATSDDSFVSFNYAGGDTQVQVEGDQFVVHGTVDESGVATGSVFFDSPPLPRFTFPEPYTQTADWTATATIPQADLAVEKLGPPTARPGNKLIYSITATNNGPSDANSFSLQDPVPANTTFVSVKQLSGPVFSCLFNSFTSTVVCQPNGTGATRRVFANGASASFQVIVKANAGLRAGTVIANTASVAAPLTDPDTSNDSATVNTVIATKGPDLAVGESGPASVVPGKYASYALRITDAGSSAMLDDTLSDPLPAGTTFVSLAQTAGPAFDCTTPAVGSGGTVSCSIDQLQTLQSSRFKLLVAVDPSLADQSTLVNTAMVSSDSVDTDNADDTATVDSTVTATADLLLTKKGPPTAVAGKAIGYTLTFRNKGPSDDTSVELRDPLPPGTTFLSLAQTGGAPANCTTPAVGGLGAVTCDVASLPVDGFAAFKLVVAVPASTPAGTVVTNDAIVLGEASDPDTANSSAAASTTITRVADVTVRKTGPASADAGKPFGYTITFRNKGPSDVANVELNDPLPTGETFVSLTQTGGTTASCTTPAVGSGGSVTCQVASLSVDAFAALRLVVTTAPDTPAGTVLINEAAALGDATDPILGNNEGIALTTLSASADLGVTNTAAPATVERGHSLGFTIKLVGHGPSDAQSVDLSDLLPAGTTFKSLTQTGGVPLSCTTPAVGGTGGVDCTVATLAPGQTATLKLLVRVTAASGTTISDTATSSSATADPQHGNDSATASSTVA